MSYFKKSFKPKCLNLNDYSHEIRNPLNGILGMTDILLDSKLDSSQKNILNNIKKSSSQLQEILNNILELSKILSGNTVYYPEQILINPYLQKILYELFLTYQKKRAKLCHFVSPELKAIAIFDPILVRKIILEIGKYIIHICHEPVINLDIYGKEDKLFINFSFNHSESIIEHNHEKLPQLSHDLLKEKQNINYHLTSSLLNLVDGSIEETSDQETTQICLKIPIHYSSLQQEIKHSDTDPELNGKRIIFFNYQSDACKSIGNYLKHWGIYFKVIDKSFQENISNIPDKNFDLIGVDISEIRAHEFTILDKIRKLSKLPVIFFKNADKANNKIISLQKDVVIIYKPVAPQDLAVVIKSVLKSEADSLRNWHKNTSSIISEYQETLKILIVDDEIINQRIMSEYLGKLQLKADLAANGEQAVIWYNENKYDLIFMDIQMPVMDGIQATQAIRANKNNHVPYIVAVTADALRGDRKSYNKVGVNDYLLKPVALNDIKKVLSKYISSLRQQ